MIKIKIYLKNKEIQGFEVTGHALCAPEGEDIVCAAISMVTQTAVLGLSQYLKLALSGTVKKGYIQCFLPSVLSDKERLQTNAILESMLLGVSQVAEDYPKAIKVEKEEVTSNDF